MALPRRRWDDRGEQQEQALEDDQQRHEAEERSSPAGNVVYLAVQKGYSLGFLVVVLGRQQLVTENTLTVAHEEKPAP